MTHGYHMNFYIIDLVNNNNTIIIVDSVLILVMYMLDW